MHTTRRRQIANPHAVDALLTGRNENPEAAAMLSGRIEQGNSADAGDTADRRRTCHCGRQRADSRTGAPPAVIKPDADAVPTAAPATGAT